MTLHVSARSLPAALRLHATAAGYAVWLLPGVVAECARDLYRSTRGLPWRR